MSKKNQSSSSLGFWIIGFITIAVFGLIIVLYFINSPKQKSNRELALTCTTYMATQFHIHPVLKIIINGQNQEIPKDIGVAPTCMNSLHTHDNTGVIHVESPEERDFNLSDFFAVWGKDMRSLGANMKMTVNGQENTDYENYVMHDKDQIELIFE